uniref:UDP-N-acetylglucosamine transferase subunit ALG14 n=1 Tax=Caligus clemensi TaxID=344056 RepID=C1C0D3_CALCM|nr:UDP-N-acetylglucosamine transferase subunit ALG14 homolog [Caligus clemensi]
MDTDIWISIALGTLAIAVHLLNRILRRTWNSLKYVPPQSGVKGGIETLIILGSGGHTTEMFKLISSLDTERFHPRIYVLAEGDENSLARLKLNDPSGTLLRVPRARSVAQSYFSSCFSTLSAFKSSLRVLIRVRPELILSNGPGTCLPLCIIGWLYRKIGILSPKTKIVFVESVCRVKSLSLTAKLLRPFVDHVLVQWPELSSQFPWTSYIDRFI